jgi:ABC-type transporter Mla subunit MlaD
MRRIAAASVLIVAVGALLVVGLGAKGGGPTPYNVRAIFDNASAVVVGEDVRIAGAPVGTITAEGVTRGKQAALTLQINNSAFVPWHANASCEIRVQSVIGEKFVDCNPGTSNYPRLSRIKHGPGAGSYYLPVTRTQSPVDFDIVQNISRLPVREQFALILNELGTGLAARGSDLNAVIRRADPALGYTDRVLKILAQQNHTLAQLATNSNTVLGALARVKRELTGFIQQANTTSVASAARATDEARSFHLLPGFLRQLQPLERDLGVLAGQGTPLFTSLSNAAPGINSQYQQLAPFARATRTALISLGHAAVQQQPALLGTIPLDKRLERLGKSTAPAATQLDRLLSSLQNTGGIQFLMKLLFNGTGATNGFDASGHYIRTQALFGSCTAYALVPVPGCSANFVHSGAAAADATLLGLSRDRPAVAAAVRSVQKTGSQPPRHALTSLLNYLLGGGR